MHIELADLLRFGFTSFLKVPCFFKLNNWILRFVLVEINSIFSSSKVSFKSCNLFIIFFKKFVRIN